MDLKDHIFEQLDSVFAQYKQLPFPLFLSIVIDRLHVAGLVSVTNYDSFVDIRVSVGDILREARTSDHRFVSTDDGNCISILPRARFSTNNKAADKIPGGIYQRGPEVFCHHCSKANYVGVKVCWNCGEKP